MVNERISDKVSQPSKFIQINGTTIHYLEEGVGDPILFLHGIPTSSYLWRNIMPYLSPLGRCIAPDLVGFGQSDKPDIAYTIDDHINYIDAFIDALKLKKLTIIMHGWGSVIGLNYAMKHESNCRGLVFYEAFLRSVNGDDISLPYQEQLLSLQAQENLPELIGDGSSFVDAVIMQNVMRDLSDVELQHYRQPFQEEGSTKPLIQYIKDLPTGEGKKHIDSIIDDYSKALTKSKLPKLLLYSVPGFITTMATLMWAKSQLPNLEIVEIGEELHLAQESNPHFIGESISIWLQSVEQL